MTSGLRLKEDGEEAQRLASFLNYSSVDGFKKHHLTVRQFASDG